jgi:hypothetical protein
MLLCLLLLLLRDLYHKQAPEHMRQTPLGSGYNACVLRLVQLLLGFNLIIGMWQLRTCRTN